MPPRQGLDKEQVVQAAADLVNVEGVEALTLGRLAKQLGVKTPSLYNHIDGLRGLQRELALLSARQLGERLGEAAMGRSGAQAVTAVAQAFRDFIKEQPGVYLSSMRASRVQAPVDTELQQAEERVLKIVLAAISAFKLEGKEALHAVRALRSMVHGFATLEIGGGFGMPLDIEESFRRMVDMLLRGLEKLEVTG